MSESTNDSCSALKHLVKYWRPLNAFGPCAGRDGTAPSRSHVPPQIVNLLSFFPKNISFVQTSSFYVCLFMVIVILLQDLDEKRIKNIKNFMLSSVDVERKVFPIIMQCLDGMETAANSINEKEVKTDTE